MECLWQGGLHRIADIGRTMKNDLMPLLAKLLCKLPAPKPYLPSCRRGAHHAEGPRHLTLHPTQAEP